MLTGQVMEPEGQAALSVEFYLSNLSGEINGDRKLPCNINISHCTQLPNVRTSEAF